MKKNILKFSLLGIGTAALALGLVFGLNSQINSASGASKFSGGTGSKFDPYLISSLEDFTELRNDVNGGATYSNTFFKLTTDIEGFTQNHVIGVHCIEISNQKTFLGNFDGDGHKVELDINQEIDVDDRCAAGMFQRFGNNGTGSIKNLTVTGSVKYKNISQTNRTHSIGGIVGYSAGGTVYNCRSECNVYATKIGTAENAGEVYVGGIIGEIHSKYTKIYNCSSTGTLEILGGCANAAGGIVGMVQADKNTEGTIKNCYSDANVSTDNEKSDPKWDSCLGGIVGWLATEAHVDNCYYYGDTLSCKTTTPHDHVGAIAGTMQSFSETSVTNCYFNNKFDNAIGLYSAGTISNVNPMSLEDMVKAEGVADSLVDTLNANIASKQEKDCMYSTWKNDEDGYPTFDEITLANKIGFNYTKSASNSNDFRIAVGIDTESFRHYQNAGNYQNAGIIVYKGTSDTKVFRMNIAGAQAFTISGDTETKTTFYMDEDTTAGFLYFTIELGDLYTNKAGASTLYSFSFYNTTSSGTREDFDIGRVSFASLLNVYLSMPEWADNPSLIQCKRDLGIK